VAAPQLEPSFASAMPWTVDVGAAALGPYFTTHRPVLDGLTVMPRLVFRMSAHPPHRRRSHLSGFADLH